MSAGNGHDETRSVVDCTEAFSLFQPRQRTSATISVRITEHTYLPDGEQREGWFPNVARAFARLATLQAREGVSMESYASVGVGPGLDAIAAVEALGVRRLALMDLHRDVVEVAKDNVLGNCPSVTPDNVTAFVSDVCDELRARGIKSDVLYENLPNIPAGEVDLTAGVMAASFFRRAPESAVPEMYSRHRLALHYRFLRQARECLSERGVVVCCIGGRVPTRIVEAMFADCGLRPDILNFEMVRQFEAESVIAGYAAAEEREQLTFRFYPYKEARAVLDDIRARGWNVAEVLDAHQLQRLSISATEAQARLAAGGDVGHLGIVWRGRPVS